MVIGDVCVTVSAHSTFVFVRLAHAYAIWSQSGKWVCIYIVGRTLTNDKAARLSSAWVVCMRFWWIRRHQSRIDLEILTGLGQREGHGARHDFSPSALCSLPRYNSRPALHPPQVENVVFFFFFKKLFPSGVRVNEGVMEVCGEGELRWLPQLEIGRRLFCVARANPPIPDHYPDITFCHHAPKTALNIHRPIEHSQLSAAFHTFTCRPLLNWVDLSIPGFLDFSPAPPTSMQTQVQTASF